MSKITNDDSLVWHAQDALLATVGVKGKQAVYALYHLIDVWLQLNVDDENSMYSTRASTDEFALPSSLVHHFVIVPSKLRLVTLAAFLTWKCMVSTARKEPLCVFV